jgi:hypothetical protein
MATAFAAGTNRRSILVIGDLPPDQAFRNRKLTLATFSTDTEALRWARAVLVRVDDDIVLDADRLTLALDHGLKVVIVADNGQHEKNAIEQLSAVGLLSAVTLRTGTGWSDVAEWCRDHDPKSGIGDVQILGSCDEEDAFLLRRAFADCKSIRVEPINGGLSGARVFRVHAVFADSAAGPRPLPFFAKTDEPARIRKEMTNYEIYVDRFIPFYLRPHLDNARYIPSHKRALIVGDFVANSEPLLAALRANRGKTAINSLFDESLRSWRLQAFEDDRGQAINVLPKALYAFDANRFPPTRVSDAKGSGARCDPTELVARLTSVKPIPYRAGPIHADLNCANVQVRLTDAILIDFYTTTFGPIVADPAALEIDVAFSYDTRKDFSDWRDVVDKLYGAPYLARIPPPAGEPTDREWMWDAVRQIRMHGRAHGPTPLEYEQAIAVYLLRRAQYPATDTADEQRRAYAYVLADALIRGMQ